jgi:hypothetical protein
MPEATEVKSAEPRSKLHDALVHLLDSEFARGTLDAEIRPQLGERSSDARALQHWPLFGVFDVRVSGPLACSNRTERVEIRSLGEAINDCSCVNRATGLAPSCEHIEAVLREQRARLGYAYQRLESRQPPQSFVFVESWGQEDSSPRIRIRPGRLSGERVEKALRRHFDSDGLLEGLLPAALERVQQDRELSGLFIGSDCQRAARLVHERAQLRRLKTRLEAQSQSRPAGLESLTEAQLTGAYWLSTRARAILNDGFGSGKSRQALAAARVLQSEGLLARVLVITDRGQLRHWQSEARVIWGRDLRVELVEGRLDERRLSYSRRATLTLVDAEAAARDRELIQRVLEPELIIVDELQRLGKVESEKRCAIGAFECNRIYGLTSVDLSKDDEALDGALKVIAPDALGSLWRELARFLGEAGGGELKDWQEQRLRDRLLRRASGSDAALPTRAIERDVSLSGLQREVHDLALEGLGFFAEKSRKGALEELDWTLIEAIVECARRACNAAELLRRTKKLSRRASSPRLEEFDALLLENKGQSQPIVAACSWPTLAKVLASRAQALGFTVRLMPEAAPEPAAPESCGLVLVLADSAPREAIGPVSLLINVDTPWCPAQLAWRLKGLEVSLSVSLLAADCLESRLSRLLLADESLPIEAFEAGKALGPRALERVLEDFLSPAHRAPSPGPAAAILLLAADPSQLERLSAGSQERLSPAISKLSARFGGRLVRILRRGERLIVVLKDPKAEDRREARDCASGLELAVLDAQSADDLERAGPGAIGEELFRPRPHVPLPAPMLDKAAEQLNEAERAAAGGDWSQALVLARDSFIQALTLSLDPRAQRTPEPQAVGRWLFGEVLPGGFITADTALRAARILCVEGAVSEKLGQAILSDARAALKAARSRKAQDDSQATAIAGSS